jgi:hypothetical protein
LLSPATMKSVIALLLLAVCANAFTDKMGGLKGSWTDSFEVESATPDNAAPGIAYTAGVTNALTCSGYGLSDFTNTWTINTTELGNNPDSPFIASCTLRFDGVGETEYPDTPYAYEWDETGKAWVTYWTGPSAAEATATIDAACDIDDGDLYVTCYFTVYEHLMAGEYKPMITLEDGLGNWAVYDDTDFATPDDGVVFTIEEVNPDVTAPMIDAASWSLTPATLTLGGASSTVDTESRVTIMVKATDGYYDYYSDCDDVAQAAGDVDEFDAWSSGLGGVMISVTSSLDSEEVMWFSLVDNGLDASPSCWRNYGIDFVFWNTAEPQTWTVTGVTAWDHYGMETLWVPTTGNTITLSYDEDALETAGGVFSCQTLDVTLYGDDGVTEVDFVTVTAAEGSDDTAYALATCVEKDTTIWNYVTVGYQSTAYTPEGETAATRRMVWSLNSGVPYGGDGYGAGRATWDQLSNFGRHVSWDAVDIDAVTYNAAPGTTTFAGVWSAYIPVYPGFPDGDYDLKTVATITGMGGVQWYDLDLGSASSVVPSVFAVLFAAIVALLRL